MDSSPDRLVSRELRICNICNQRRLEVRTSICPSCSAFFHKTCLNDHKEAKESRAEMCCPKCGVLATERPIAFGPSLQPNRYRIERHFIEIFGLNQKRVDEATRDFLQTEMDTIDDESIEIIVAKTRIRSDHHKYDQTNFVDMQLEMRKLNRRRTIYCEMLKAYDKGKMRIVVGEVSPDEPWDLEQELARPGPPLEATREPTPTTPDEPIPAEGRRSTRKANNSSNSRTSRDTQATRRSSRLSGLNATNGGVTADGDTAADLPINQLQMTGRPSSAATAAESSIQESPDGPSTSRGTTTTPGRELRSEMKKRRKN